MALRFAQLGFDYISLSAAGKLDDPAMAEAVLNDGTMDFLAIARGLLADPSWPNKVKKGELGRPRARSRHPGRPMPAAPPRRFHEHWVLVGASPAKRGLLIAFGLR